METLRDLDLVRTVPAGRAPLTVRAAGDGGGMPTLEVRFSPFDVWYEVDSWWEGNFLERTVRGAFSKTMSEARAAAVMPVKMLYEHGYDPFIGNKPLALVETLAEETDSAVASGTLFDAGYVRDLVPGLEAGVFGSSFRFRVIQESWNDEPGISDHNPKGLPERTVTEVRLFEQGPVTFPANPAATAGLRSVVLCGTDELMERMRAREPETVARLAERATQIRTPGRGAAAAGTVPGQGAAGSRTSLEPASGHSGGTGQRRRREAVYPYLKEGALQ